MTQTLAACVAQVDKLCLCILRGVTSSLTVVADTELMKCWICGDTADSREHFAKASDLRDYFGRIEDEPVYKHTDTSLNDRIHSTKSNKLTFKTRLCRKCNNELTQPYDCAWAILSKYLQTNWPIIVKNKHFFWSKVFDNDTQTHALRVHLYFVKLFGCRILEERVPFNIGGFSEALLSGRPHANVFLTFANAPDIEIKDDRLGFFSKIQFGNYHSLLPDIGAWTYMFYPVSVRVSYLSRASPPEYRSRAWHPSQPSTQVRLGNYHVSAVK